MTPRPHDALFKSAFESPSTAAALLRELLPGAVRSAIAWRTLSGERGSFVDALLADHHSDLLFSARLRAGKRELVYFLLEHQSANDPTMPLRMLSYQSRIWDRFVEQHPSVRLAPIIAMLVTNVPDGWNGPRAFEELFDPAVVALPELAALVPRFSMIVDDLARLSDGDLAARPLPPFPRLALWLLRDARDSATFLDSFDAWIPAMLALERTRSGRDRLTTLVTYMFHVISPLHLEPLRAKLRTLGSRTQELAMTIAEQLRKEGLKKGREEGLKKGLKKGHEEGRLATLRSMLLFKFHTLGAKHEARLKAATPEAINRYLQRLLTADSLAAVFDD
jgi:predicted transposase YdaD